MSTGDAKLGETGQEIAFMNVVSPVSFAVRAFA